MLFFRILSVIEGLSFLFILAISAGWITRDILFVAGMAHGILFLLYFIASLVVSHKQTWSVIIWLAVTLAAVVPFAFIGVELFLRRQAKNGVPAS